VYEAVRAIKHDLLITKDQEGSPTDDGMRVFLKAVRDSLKKEAPIQEAEAFDKCLYDRTVWRRPGESMTAYIIRRQQEFKQLRNDAAGCEIPDRLQAHLLLKFSGLNRDQRREILSSCNNEIDKAKFETALRMQHPTIHAGPDQGGRPFKGGATKAKGIGKSLGKSQPRRQAFAAEEDYDEGLGVQRSSKQTPSTRRKLKRPTSAIVPTKRSLP
jgi:hypothetical protein